jgi:hypothetical protein
MDMYSLYQKSFNAGRYLLLTIVMLNLFSVAFAQSQIASALGEVCRASQTFLGAAIMIMILLAGATYALGQVLGAETRARASVWATAMMTGAIIGALIYLLTPVIIKALLPTGSGVSFSANNPCPT